MKLSAVLLALLVAAPLAAQHTYDLVIDPARSGGTWGGTSTFGTLTNTTPYEFDGTMRVRLQNSSPPFGQGELLTSSLVTVPSTITGEVPNPIPGLPPLARLSLQDLEAEAYSLFPFPIDPAGSFSALAEMEFKNGTVVIDPFGVPPFNLPIVGYVTGGFSFPGTLTQQGGDVVFSSPYDLSWNIGIAGIGVLGFNRGDLTAEAPIVGGGMILSVPPLVSNTTVTVTLGNGAPNATTYLVYSISGLGSTPVPALNVTLGLANPQLAAPPVPTDAAGNASWNLAIPAAARIGVWFQSMQFGAVSNIPFEVIT